MLSWQNVLSNKQIVADIEEKLANQGEVFRNREGIFTFPYQANENHDTEPSTVGHVISQRQ